MTTETNDAFLGGRVHALQPKKGFRAGTDTVFLAAAIPAKSGDTVFELGAGSGVGLLCLGRRINGLELSGVELLTDNATRANANLKQANLKGSVRIENALEPSIETRQIQFHHVMMNPPFYDKNAYSPPLQNDKSHAHIADTPIADWVRAGCKRTRPKGSLTIIHLAEKLGGILSAFEDMGNVHILPIASHKDRSAKRIIVQAWRQSARPLVLLPPLILYDEHGNSSTRAEEIARDGDGLSEIWC